MKQSLSLSKLLTLKNHLGFIMTLISISLFAVYCTKNRASNDPVHLVKLTANASLGSILADKDGRTLYYFANDAAGVPTCTGGCAAVWPLFYAGNLTATDIDPALNLSDFGSVSTSSGSQTTYKGRPLYYYAPNNGTTNVLEAPGLTSGENVNGVWFVAKPDYTIMLSNAQLVGHDGKSYLSNYTEGVGKTKYFTDGNGITLYSYVKDSANKNKFTKADFSNDAVWPIYQQTKIVVPSSVDASQFSVIDVFGKKQLTYKGWPVYYFGSDSLKLGLNKGISYPKPGVWPILNTTITDAPK